MQARFSEPSRFPLSPHSPPSLVNAVKFGARLELSGTTTCVPPNHVRCVILALTCKHQMCHAQGIAS